MGDSKVTSKVCLYFPYFSHFSYFLFLTYLRWCAFMMFHDIQDVSTLHLGNFRYPLPPLPPLPPLTHAPQVDLAVRLVLVMLRDATSRSGHSAVLAGEWGVG